MISLKNGLIAMLGVIVIIDTLIAMVIPPEHLYRWKLLVLALGIISVVAIVWQAVKQSKDDKRSEKRDARVDEILEKLANQTSSPTPAVESREIKAGDPRIYVDVDPGESGAFRKTAFVLKNHGGDVAQNVQIQPIKSTFGEATFDTVAAIAPDQEKQAFAEIGRFGNFQRHNVVELMMREWDAGGEAKPEFSKPVTVLYEDFSKHRFQTTFDLVLFPIAQIIADGRSGRGARGGRGELKILEARNFEIKTLPKAL